MAQTVSNIHPPGTPIEIEPFTLEIRNGGASIRTLGPDGWTVRSEAAAIEEPHHAAARHRTDEEQSALEPTNCVTGDELRALLRVGSDRGIVTVDPGSAL